MDDQITGSKALGVKLHNWHDSQQDPVYTVGSMFYAGLSAPREDVRDALYNLKLELASISEEIRHMAVNHKPVSKALRDNHTELFNLVTSLSSLLGA
jgi:hypothetical protein